MSGILGGTNQKWNYIAGIDCLKHRGPFKQQICKQQDVVFAFAQFSYGNTIGTGVQPLFNQERTVGIFFDGEIYGYDTLKEKLIVEGCSFETGTAAEIMLKAYLTYGEKFIQHMDGMYAIVIYDKREKTLRLYRDRIGMKPLYYFYDGVNFAFSSELKGITNMCDNVTFEVDTTSVYDFLYYKHIPDDKTYYKNVFKLLPGYQLVFDLDNHQIEKVERYWRLKVNSSQGKKRKQEEIVEEIRSLLQLTLKEQMVYDVPVGAYLSGGIDSSIVSYECAQINPDVETFTMGFKDKLYDESKYAEYFADKFGLKKNIGVFDASNYQMYEKQLVRLFDEPFGATHACPTYMIAEMAKKKVPVIFSGNGGDEIFGGYSFYQVMKQREENKVPDHMLLSMIYSHFDANGDKDIFWLDDLSYILKYRWGEHIPNDKEIRKKLGIPKDYDQYWLLRKYYNKELPPFTRLQYLDLKTIVPGRILTVDDRVGMAVSLETRFPFYSKRIVEFAFSLSEEDRCPCGELKSLLKCAYSPIFGETYMNRKKQGFDMPRRYFKQGISPQQHVLENVWKYKL